MTTTAADEHLAPTAEEAPPASLITTDLPCPCGYNLRGRARDGRCPECGAAVADALRLHAQVLGGPAALRRMVLGLAIILAANVAWALSMTYIGHNERSDHYAYYLAGVSGVKTFIVVPATHYARPWSPPVFLVPTCHVVALLGTWLLTTPLARGHGTMLGRTRLALRWTATAVVLAALFASFLGPDAPRPTLACTSLADALVGALWGTHLAVIASTLGRAKWLHVGGWSVAVGSSVLGTTFACAFLFFWPSWPYWETWLWTSLTAWAATGMFCSILMAVAYQRLRRELRKARSTAAAAVDAAAATTARHLG